jgi:hypothetical protein
MKTISEILVTATSLAALVVAAAACSPENPRLMAPPLTYSDAVVEAKPQEMTVEPKVDILFVMDNSGSMSDEQAKLSDNVDKFAMAIAKNSGIDFHVGVTSVWDSKIFAGMKKEYGHGELRRLKSPKGDMLPDSFGRFVSSKENYDSYLTKQDVGLSKKPGWVQILAATVKIGIEHHREDWAKSGKGGPDNEEVFSPVKAALGEAMANGANKNFRRSDAHLVLLFITDTDAYMKDSKTGERQDINGDELIVALAEHVGLRKHGEAERQLEADRMKMLQEKITIIGVLAQADDDEGEKDPVIQVARGGLGRPENITRFISDMGGQQMGLRGQDYGTRMASLGDLVREKALQKPRVLLNAVPEAGTEKVTLNGEPLVHGDAGWLYDNESPNTIVINGDLSKGAGPIEIKVYFTSVDSQAVNSGRAKAISK